MTKTKEQIIHDIEYHVGWERDSEDFPHWYVGITANPEDRLFNDHNVNKDDKGDWIYRQAADVQVAREVERYFIEKHLTKGGPAVVIITLDMYMPTELVRILSRKPGYRNPDSIAELGGHLWVVNCLGQWGSRGYSGDLDAAIGALGVPDWRAYRSSGIVGH